MEVSDTGLLASEASNRRRPRIGCRTTRRQPKCKFSLTVDYRFDDCMLNIAKYADFSKRFCRETLLKSAIVDVV